MKTLVIVGFMALILYQLGAGLYYMMVDKGTTNRTVRALTKRIGLSILLIAGVAVAIASGAIEPHGIGVAPAATAS